MIKDTQKRAIELCLAIYRITDKFPKHEILRNKIRGISVDVIEFLAHNSLNSAHPNRILDYKDLEKIIRVFEKYCDIAQKQGWVREENFQILRSEYRKLYRDLADLAQSAEPDPINKENSEKRIAPKRSNRRSVAKNYAISDRQEKIIKFLNKNIAGATMEDLAKVIAVSKKTVERNLKPLVKNKLIYRKGNTRSTKFFGRI